MRLRRDRLPCFTCIEPLAERFPSRKALIHEPLEIRAVIVDGKVGELVDNDIFDEFPRFAREFGVIGYVAVTPVTAPPNGFDSADFPGNIRFADKSRPFRVQLREKCAQICQLRLGHGRKRGHRRTRKDFRPRSPHPVKLGDKEVFRLMKRRAVRRNGKDDLPAWHDLQADPPTSATDNRDRYFAN